MLNNQYLSQSLEVGAELIPHKKDQIELLQLVKYAGASGDFNPIHFDEKYAVERGLPNIITHGMLNMGFLSEFAGKIINNNGFVKRVKVRFVRMLVLGDTPICKGRVVNIHKLDEGSDVILNLWVENSRGEYIVEGEAVVRLLA